MAWFYNHIFGHFPEIGLVVPQKRADWEPFPFKIRPFCADFELLFRLCGAHRHSGPSAAHVRNFAVLWAFFEKMKTGLRCAKTSKEPIRYSMPRNGLVGSTICWLQKRQCVT